MIRLHVYRATHADAERGHWPGRYYYRPEGTPVPVAPVSPAYATLAEAWNGALDSRRENPKHPDACQCGGCLSGLYEMPRETYLAGA